MMVVPPMQSIRGSDGDGTYVSLMVPLVARGRYAWLCHAGHVRGELW
jgi:hypothetical protein